MDACRFSVVYLKVTAGKTPHILITVICIIACSSAVRAVTPEYGRMCILYVYVRTGMCCLFKKITYIMYAYIHGMCIVRHRYMCIR